MALLFPDVLVPVELLPGLEVVGTEALGWFSGTGTGSPNYASIHGDAKPELLWAYQPGILAESWSLRLVDIEEAIKAQVHELHRVESVPDSPTMSEKQRSIRNENVDHARRVMKLLKNDWHDTVYDHLIRKYGPGKVPDGAYGPERIARIEDQIHDDDA